MTLKRWTIFMFLFFAALFMGAAPAFAEDADGECKLTDDYKKQIAQQGINSAAQAWAKLKNLSNKVIYDYDNDNGVCHFLKGSSSKWWSEAFKSQLKYEDDVIKGAKWVDDNTSYTVTTTSSGSQKCSWFIEQVNSDDLKKYTDWDFPELRKNGQKHWENLLPLIQWAETAQAGDYIEVKGDAEDDICVAAGGCLKDTFENDCDKLVKRSDGAIWCVDTGTGSVSVSKDAAYDKDIAYRFGSVDDFKNKLSKYEKCLNSLKEMEELRGNLHRSDSFIGHYNDARRYLTILGSSDVMCTCKRDIEGNPTAEVEECRVIGFAEKDNFQQKCATIAEYQAEYGDTCLTCGLMAKILSAVQRISMNAFEVIRGDLIKVLTLAFLIYIAYVVLITIASPEEQKLSKFLNTLLMQGFKVAVAILILTYPDVLYDKAINPILDGAVDFGLSFSNINDSNGGDTVSSKIKEYGAEYASEFNSDINYLSASTLEKMVGANKNFSREASFMPAVGSALICNSWYKVFGIPMPRFKMFVTGVILYIFGIMIWLAIGFYILDCCLQLGIVVAMMSFFVACWPFKLTSAYVKVGWNMFLNTFFNFIMMSVIIVTIAELTKAALPAEIMQDINEDNVDAINDSLEIVGLSIIILVVISMICLKLARESGRLANKFAGGAQIKMGADLGGLAADTETKKLVSGLKTGWRAVSGGVSSAAEASGAKGAINKGIENIKNATGGRQKSQSASFGGAQGGNQTGGNNSSGGAGTPPPSSGGGTGSGNNGNSGSRSSPTGNGG